MIGDTLHVMSDILQVTGEKSLYSLDFFPSVLLSIDVERFSVSQMQDFFSYVFFLLLFFLFFIFSLNQSDYNS